MHAGHFVGYIKDKGRIVTDAEFLMLEEFMQKYGITDTTNIVGPYQDKVYATKMRDALVKTCLIYIHGSDNPKIVSSARNTSLFETRGPLVGDIGGKLDMSLIEFVGRLKPEHLPEMSELPSNGNSCTKCGRSFPEPDGFGGCRNGDEHLCFSCYQNNR